jgi:PPOX class probable F420-dependent enzyme
MVDLPESARALIRSGTVAHCTTLDADGSPQLSAVWVGLADDDPNVVVMAHLPRNAKVRNLQRDPRIGLWLQTDERNAIGMQHYLVLRGTAQVTEGGAPELLTALAKVYGGADVEFPLPEDPPPGYVVRITTEKIRGYGPWVEDGATGRS